MSVRSVAVRALVLLAVLFVGGMTFADTSWSGASLVGYAEARDVGASTAQNGDGSGSTGSCCGDQSCGCDNECCCEPRWHWTGGVEATYLDPNFHNSGIFKLVDPGWTAAPRIWLGVENCNGWGARVRYWQLCANRTAFGIQPAEDVLVDLSQSLDMYDIDCELTKRFDLGCWKLLGTFGGRYASLGGLLHLNVLDFPDTSVFEVFDGLTTAGGLTFALELSRPIGCTGVEVFGTLRASPLWGNNRLNLRARVNNDGDLTSVDQRQESPTDLTIWEAQVGLQCSKYLACCCGTVFARGGFEYQSWVLSDQGDVTSTTDLYGVAVAVGFTR